jgi:hypothetical protein
MDFLEIKLAHFLGEAQDRIMGMDSAVLDEAAASFRDMLDDQFNADPVRKFRLRMSNMGRPLCQLQMEAKGVRPDSVDSSLKMKFIYGHAVEIISLAIMQAAGVEIEEYHTKGKLDINGHIIEGESDIKINGQIFDIKSCSDWAFRNKWINFDTMKAGDTFGYVVQLFGYSESQGCEAGGWFVVNKQTGEWRVIRVPESQRIRDSEVEDMVAHLEHVVDVIDNDLPFKRCFSDKEETWYKKATGRRVLASKTCEFCDFKRSCWPGLTWAEAGNHQAGKRPGQKWYTDMGVSDNVGE